MTTYRTGTHHGITICAEGDGARCGREGHDCARGHLVAVVVEGTDDLTAVELAERICALLNGPQPLLKAVNLTPEQFEEVRAGILQALRKDGPSAVRIQPWVSGTARAKLTDMQERADVRRRIAEQAEHRPSSLGDGLGYGPCTGCGELWPCTASRDEVS